MECISIHSGLISIVSGGYKTQLKYLSVVLTADGLSLSVGCQKLRRGKQSDPLHQHYLIANMGVSGCECKRIRSAHSFEMWSLRIPRHISRHV